MTGVNGLETFDAAVYRADREAKRRLLKRLERLLVTPDNELSARDAVAKHVAVEPIVALMDTLWAEADGTVLDEVTRMLRRECSAWQAKLTTTMAKEGAELWFWYGDQCHLLKWDRINGVSVKLRLAAMIELLDVHEPEWRQYVQRGWCRQGRPILQQVFSTEPTFRPAEAFALGEALGMPEDDVDLRILWLARHGLICHDVRAGRPWEADDPGYLRLAWWREASNSRPNRRAIRRQVSSSIILCIRAGKILA